MSELNSALYVGKVGHTRLRPFHHDFEYRIYTLVLDLDELPAISRRLRLFSYNRFNLFALFDRDHGGRDGSGLRAWVDSQLAAAGIDLAGGPVRLLSFPRVLGYTFDPLSIWYCYHADGSLRAVLHEVKNTFGEQHVYLVPIDGDLEHQFAKELFVSPFMDMDATYSFTLTLPDQRLSVGILQSDADGDLLRASVRASRLELSDRHLLRVFMTHPLLTLKVIGAIHWQAWRLWRKGGQYRRRPLAPTHPVTVVDPPARIAAP
ncbi:MAG: DUF1365 domain-containing protein [Acidimicrobiia bacterium]|nr:DUF1365 domain-containing protein [Acidimicrobiia bacterium]